MWTYNVDLTIVDSTQVCADSVDEAELLAWEIFQESGHDMSNAELNAYMYAEEEI